MTQTTVEVLLVNTPISHEERYGKLAAFGNHLPNLGLAQMAGFLREKGVVVQILDAALLGWGIEHTAKYVADAAPRIAGLTATTMAISRAAALASKIKQYSHKTKIAVGGAHISSRPWETMENYRSIDYGIMHEGEFTIWELVQSLRKGHEPYEVAGLIARDHGDIYMTDPRPPIKNLDELPMPAWDLLPNLAKHYHPSPQSYKRLPSTILFTSRGCPYRCTFCDRTLFGQKYRHNSPRRIYEMMKHLNDEYGIVDFAFHDELFLVSERDVVELCQYITRNGHDWTWSCQGRADMPITSYGLDRMAEAGCWQIQFGVESGADEILTRMQKDLTAAQMLETFERVSAAGIRSKGFLMVGFPGESEATLAETEEFIVASKLDDVMITYFTPFPGVEVYDGVEQHGHIVGGYETHNDHYVAFVPNGLTAEQLIAARNRMYRRFYLRSRTVWDYVKRLREPSVRPHLLRAASQFLAATR
ncbi:radical SAM protein [bacterium]|nr:radical SAM protein [bacterium]